MGTLMASGIMEAGKSLNEKDKIDTKDLALYFESFAAGIKKKKENVRRETEQYTLPCSGR